MEQTCLILGAGFSYSSGLPLTNQIFDDITVSPSAGKKLSEIYIRVKQAWGRWKVLNGNNCEQWLLELYKIRPVNMDQVSYDDAIDFLMARITNIPRKYGKNGAYYYGISTSILNIDHQEFWKTIRKKFDIKNIITTNYDIVIEQGLRDNYSPSSNNRQAPDCRYGGFPESFEQKIRIITDVINNTYREDVLNGDIKLYKLHGSINWVSEPHGFKIHDDVRAVYRSDRSMGKPDLIPPVLEKDQPEWAYRIWEYAKKSLINSPIWFVCGYSLPNYDKAVYDLFINASKQKSYVKIFISDPDSKNLVGKWQKAIACKNDIIPLEGIPYLNQQIHAL